MFMRLSIRMSVRPLRLFHEQSITFSPYFVRYSPASLESFRERFGDAWRRVVERDMWTDSRTFLDAICNDSRHRELDDDDDDGDDDVAAKASGCRSVIDFDASGQPSRRRVGLLLTTRKKRCRLNSIGGATSKGDRSGGNFGWKDI